MLKGKIEKPWVKKKQKKKSNSDESLKHGLIF